MERDTTQTKFRNKKSNSYNFISDIAESNYDDCTLKTYINLLNSMLFRTLGVIRGGHLRRNYFTCDSACAAIIFKRLR